MVAIIFTFFYFLFRIIYETKFSSGAEFYWDTRFTLSEKSVTQLATQLVTLLYNLELKCASISKSLKPTV